LAAGVLATGAFAQSTPSSTAVAPVDTCKQAKALADAKRTEDAAKAYAKALESEGTFACATEGLNKIAATSPPTACSRGDALALLHLNTEAKAQYTEALKAEPKSKCGNEGIHEVTETSLSDWLTSAVKDVGAAAGALALAAAIVVGFLMALKGIWRLMTGKARKPRVKLETFESPEAAKPLGAGFAGLIRSDLIASRWGDDRLDVLTGQDTGSKALAGLVAALPDAAKPVGALLTLLEKLVARPVLTVSGVLYLATHLGRGASVLVGRDIGLVAGTDLWSHELLLDDGDEEPETVRRLSAPAAAFVRHVYASGYAPDPAMGDSAYGWALTRMAQSWCREGDLEKAISMCREAIDKSPNVVACGLLGQLLAILAGYDQQALIALDGPIDWMEHDS
jgi:tetratricopeptide (TPR) repeat protein